VVRQRKAQDPSRKPEEIRSFVTDSKALGLDIPSLHDGPKTGVISCLPCHFAPARVEISCRQLVESERRVKTLVHIVP